MGCEALDLSKCSQGVERSVVFSHSMSLQEIEKSVILQTLCRQRYNRTHTARALGIGLRTLQRKLKEYRELGGGVVVDLPK